MLDYNKLYDALAQADESERRRILLACNKIERDGELGPSAQNILSAEQEVYLGG